MQQVMQQQEMNNVEQTGVTPEEANIVNNTQQEQIPINQ